MTLRLTDEETEALRAAAAREGRSMQEVVKSAIADYVGRRARLRDAVLDQVVERDKGLLDRLAQ